MEFERPVRPVEWLDDECDAHRSLWTAMGSGVAAGVVGGESARTAVVSVKRTARMKRERRMPCLRFRELP